MTRTITCIECPIGCRISVDIENCKAVKISGNKCPKGEIYSIYEVENPSRILTAAVLTKNLQLKMVPVRTDAPIPKAKIFEAMDEIRKIVVAKPVSTGDIIIKNFLNLGVNLIATRDCLY